MQHIICSFCSLIRFHDDDDDDDDGSKNRLGQVGSLKLNKCRCIIHKPVGSSSGNGNSSSGSGKREKAE